MNTKKAKCSATRTCAPRTGRSPYTKENAMGTCDSVASAWSQALGMAAVVFALMATATAQPPMEGPMGPGMGSAGSGASGMSNGQSAQSQSRSSQAGQSQLSQAKVQWVRQAMTASGYADTTTQNAVLSFMQKQEQERQTLRQQERQMSATLVSDQASDEQVNAQLVSFRNAVVQSDARVTQALTALDRVVHYSTQPRLEMLLTVLGVVGQETASLGGIGTVFPESGFAASN